MRCGHCVHASRRCPRCAPPDFSRKVWSTASISRARASTRDSFSTTRVDYLNHPFDRRAYLVAAAANPHVADLDVLIARVVFSIAPRDGVAPPALRAAVLAALPARPLEVRELDDEVL